MTATTIGTEPTVFCCCLLASVVVCWLLLLAFLLRFAGVGCRSESRTHGVCAMFSADSGVYPCREGYGDLVPTVPGARLWLIFTALPMLGFVAFFVEHWVDTFQLIEGSIRKACVAKCPEGLLLRPRPSASNPQPSNLRYGSVSVCGACVHACRFAARPNKIHSEHGKACCGKQTTSAAFFEISLFLLAIVMVLLVNVAFISALVVDMSSAPGGAGSASGGGEAQVGR